MTNRNEWTTKDMGGQRLPTKLPTFVPQTFPSLQKTLCMARRFSHGLKNCRRSSEKLVDQRINRSPGKKRTGGNPTEIEAEIANTFDSLLLSRSTVLCGFQLCREPIDTFGYLSIPCCSVPIRVPSLYDDRRFVCDLPRTPVVRR